MANAITPPALNPPDSEPIKPPVTVDATLAEYSRFTQTLVKAWRSLVRPIRFGGANVPWIVLFGVGVLGVASVTAVSPKSGRHLALTLLLGSVLRYLYGGSR